MAFKQLPLNQDDFTMKLIEDLGRLPSPSNPTRFYRFAIFECTKCKQHFKARATGDKAKTQTCCINCVGSHNKSYDTLYAIWNGIRQRCYNPKRKDYHKYGGKGVTMSPEWKDDVTAFISWCEENGWKPGLVIDKDIKSKELGVKEEDLAKLALDCSRNKTRSLIGYKPLAYEDILVIYQMAYERG